MLSEKYQNYFLNLIRNSLKEKYQLTKEPIKITFINQYCLDSCLEMDLFIKEEEHFYVLIDEEKIPVIVNLHEGLDYSKFILKKEA